MAAGDGAEHEREFHVEPERDQRTLHEKDGDHRLENRNHHGVKPTRLKYERLKVSPTVNAINASAISEIREKSLTIVSGRIFETAGPDDQPRDKIAGDVRQFDKFRQTAEQKPCDQNDRKVH